MEGEQTPNDDAINEDVPKRFEGHGTRFSGTEPIFGAYTNTSNILNNIRMTHHGQIFVQVMDIGAAVTTLAREYKFHGDPVRAYQDIVRIRANFDSRVQRWKNEETNRLQNKSSLNGNQIRELEKELNRVKLEISRGESSLNRLQNDLDLISRVGDECPLLKPQQGEASFKDDEYVVPVMEKKKKPNLVLADLAKLVQPDGLKMSFKDAIFRDDFDDAIREHHFDQHSHLSVIVHWSDRNPLTRDRGEIYLRILLVPKSVEAYEQLAGIVEKYDFVVLSGSNKQRLKFDVFSIHQEKTIVEKKLMDYLYDIEATSFQHKNLIIKRPFEFFAADFCSAISFELVSTTVFLLKVVKK